MPSIRSETIKVLIIDPANFVGGAELFTIDLVNYITPRYPDIQVDIVYNGNEAYRKLIHPAVNTFILPFPKLKKTGLKGIYNFYKSARDLRELVQNGHYDLVQTNSVRTHLTGSLALRKSKTKLVWFMHDFTAPPRVTKAFSNIPKHIFCCSSAVKEYVISKITPRLASKISIIPNGIDCALPPPPPANNTFPKIGIVGRIDEWKGQKYFIQAAFELLSTFPQAKFYVIGAPHKYDIKTGAYFSELKYLVKEKKAEDKIILTGFKENIISEIAKLDIVAHCSIEKEPFGRVIIEAMSLGKPVIATNIGGPLEIINNQENGILIDPKNTDQLVKAITFLLQDPQFASKMGDKAKQTIRNNFSLAQISQNIIQTWRHLF